MAVTTRRSEQCECPRFKPTATSKEFHDLTPQKKLLKFNKNEKNKNNSGHMTHERNENIWLFNADSYQEVSIDWLTDKH